MDNKYKISELYKGRINGFQWIDVYSNTNETDKFGRWQRRCLFNGLCLATISGFVKSDFEKLERERVGTVDFIVPNLYFPTTSNQVAGGINFNNVDEAKKYVEEMFFDFRSHINL